MTRGTRTRGGPDGSAAPGRPAPPEASGAAEGRGGPAAAARGRLSAWVLIVVLAVGAASAVLSPVWRSPPEGRLLDGSWTTAFEGALLEDTALLGTARAAWGAIDLLVFRQGLPGVLIGRDGWLFTTEEFAPSEVEARFTVDAPVAEVAAVAERLEADGVDLQVVLVPAKARIEPRALGPHALPDAARARYDVLRTALLEAGVEVIDGEAAMARAGEDGPVFLRTDTHWTPAGAAAVAEAVADRVAARHADAAWLGATPYRMEREEDLVVEGDLLAYVPLGPLADAVGPPPDVVERWRARAVPAGGAGDDARAPDGTTDDASGGLAGALFGEVRLPVTLVGTSYSADERWGFADRLRAALGTDVLVAASEGEGPFEPMHRYLDGEAYASTPPEVVIWEIPERYAWPEVGW